jgi:hypothetical protein
VRPPTRDHDVREIRLHALAFAGMNPDTQALNGSGEEHKRRRLGRGRDVLPRAAHPDAAPGTAPMNAQSRLRGLARLTVAAL